MTRFCLLAWSLARDVDVELPAVTRAYLHYDADFDLISDVTGQKTEWVVPRGSIA